MVVVPPHGQHGRISMCPWSKLQNPVALKCAAEACKRLLHLWKHASISPTSSRLSLWQMPQVMPAIVSSSVCPSTAVDIAASAGEAQVFAPMRLITLRIRACDGNSCSENGPEAIVIALRHKARRHYNTQAYPFSSTATLR